MVDIVKCLCLLVSSLGLEPNSVRRAGNIYKVDISAIIVTDVDFEERDGVTYCLFFEI